MAALMFRMFRAISRRRKVRLLGSTQKTVFAHQNGYVLPIGENLRETDWDEGEAFRVPVRREPRVSCILARR